ncbi:MAG: GNAT family N-acetyltransferase [Candidatus Nanopelagicales bacterium]
MTDPALTEPAEVVLPALDPVLPEALDAPELAGRLVLRTWRESDLPAMAEAITASLEHLRPWMPWIAFEPLPPEERNKLIAAWEQERAAGGGAVYGVWARTQQGERVVGGTGLHRRIAADGIEIGYWLVADAQGQGIMTQVVAVLTDYACGQPGITHVEIHTDAANARSAAVAGRCGYTLVERVERTPQAPGELGETLIWRFPEDPDR